MRYLSTWWWIALFTGAIVLDFYLFLPPLPTQPPFLLEWLELGASVLTSGVFAMAGFFVTRFGQSHRVTSAFTWYSATGTITFAVLPAAIQGHPLATDIGLLSSALSVVTLVLLLLEISVIARPRLLWHRITLAALLCSYLFVACSSFLLSLQPTQALSWLLGVVDDIFLCWVACAFFLAFLLFRQASAKQKGYLRVLWWSMFAAILPFFILTLLPKVLHLPYIDGQFTAMFLIILPGSLVFVLLRYRLLFVPTHLRSRVADALRLFGFVILVHYPTATILTLWLHNGLAGLLDVTILSFVSMRYWRAGHDWIERYCFGNFQQYRLAAQHFHAQIDRLNGGGVQEVADLVCATVRNATQVKSLCLFLLDEETGLFCLAPAEPLTADDHRLMLLNNLFEVVPPLQLQPQHGIVEWLPPHGRLLQKLEAVSLPAPLSSLVSNAVPKDLLFLPICSPQDQRASIIGIVVLDDGHFDQDVCDNLSYLGAQLAPALERARKQRRYGGLIWTKWLLENKPALSSTVQEILYTYAKMAALLLNTGVHIWTLADRDNLLYQASVGNVNPSTPTDVSLLVSNEDWNRPYYFGGAAGVVQDIPPVLRPFKPDFPLAWLPVTLPYGDHIGILHVTYRRTQAHNFSADERAVLHTLVEQCVQQVHYLLWKKHIAELQQRILECKEQIFAERRQSLYELSSLQGCLFLLGQSTYETPELHAQLRAKADQSVTALRHQLEQIRVAAAEMQQKAYECNRLTSHAWFRPS